MPPPWRRVIAIGIAVGVLALINASYASASLQPIPVPLAAPDLVPATADVRPSPAFEGDVLEVRATLANRGDVTAVYATLDLTDIRPDGKMVTIGQTPLTTPISPGNSIVVTMSRFLAVGAGLHMLTVRVGNVTPAESDGSNDVLAIPVSVGPAKAPPPPTPPSDGFRVEALASLGIGAILGFVLILFVIGATVLVVARRIPSAMEPPSPEPPDRSPPPIWPP